MGERGADVSRFGQRRFPQPDGQLRTAGADGFCNGPTSAEYQGDFIVECLAYLRERNLTRIEATPETERKKCLDLAKETLFAKADLWYMGANIPGRVREMLMYPDGLPLSLQELRESAEKGYTGYVLD